MPLSRVIAKMLNSGVGEMLKSIGVNNYRTFPEFEKFELAPLTIMLGANSSGKSSITRLLPLFAQSMSMRSAAPILWVSDNLDYGSFYDNVHNHDTSENITFTFGGSVHLYGRRRQRALFHSPGPSDQKDQTPFEYAISVSGSPEKTDVTCIEIRIHGQTVRMPVSGSSLVERIFLNGSEVPGILKEKEIFYREGLFPDVLFVKKEKPGLISVGSGVFLTEAARVLRRYAHQNTSIEKITNILVGLTIGTPEETMAQLAGRSYEIATLRKNISSITNSDRERIWFLCFLAGLPILMTEIREAISPDVTAGGYLGPIRARASRYYRRQELAVDQIDPSGENLAMYLNSLHLREREEINSDLEEFFGHQIKVHAGEGHISLRISASGQQHEDNLADVGFGFSQLLPVIAQIHATARSLTRITGRTATTTRPDSPLIAVEQPELHLHPAYQAKLGAYFVHAATRKKSGVPPFRFLIETHSEPLVNEVAALVARGAIAPEDVRLYLFERPPGRAGTSVVQADIQSNGTIPNWPFGFFTSGKIRSAAKL